MYNVSFANLVDLDKPELAIEGSHSRKRKESHDLDADYWTPPFHGNDHGRRKEATRAVAGRPGSARTTIRHLPELHKAINGMNYASRHANEDKDPVCHVQGPDYFTTYDEETKWHTQGVGNLSTYKVFPGYYELDDDSVPLPPGSISQRSPPRCHRLLSYPRGPTSCKTRAVRPPREVRLHRLVQPAGCNFSRLARALSSMMWLSLLMRNEARLQTHISPL